MTSWLTRAGHWLPLALVAIGIGVLADAQAFPSNSLRPSAVTLGAGSTSPDELDEPNGLIAQHTGGARRPTPAKSVAQLLADELHPQRAPVPSGPVTYVPILLYHYIRINPNPRDRVGFSLSTPPLMFAQQMQYLADHGFHVIPLHQAVLAIKNHSGLPAHSVVLTFDDGYADFFTQAIPVMRRYGFTATDFVISGKMGQWSFMTPSQVVAADAMGFNIGAHTVDHVALAAQTPARARWEILTSKSVLEGLLGHKLLDVAYPYGSFNAYDMAQAQAAGFETAVSTLYGTVHTPGQLFYLSRMRIGGGLSLNYFASVVGGPAPTLAELRSPGPSPASTAAASPSPSPKPTVTPTGVATALAREDLTTL